jgi:RNA polymerase sigma-70 factor (ECF subfamily)
MADDSAFEEMMRRVRAGDEEAAAELVRRYESKIRRVVRFNLDSRLQRHFDSMDVCQSVLASFFVRAGLGQYELHTPGEVLNLLAVMARNKLTNRVKHQRRARRDHRRVTAADDTQAADDAPSPSEQVANRELLVEARRRLSEEERQLLELREQGQEWAEIAAAQGSSAEALRKKLGRAIERVVRELGLEGDGA